MLKRFCLCLFLFLAGCGTTPTIIPTLRATPISHAATSTPKQDLTFSDKNINKIPPADVIREIAYFGMPGGGGGPWCFDTDAGDATSPTFMFDYGNDDHPLEIYNPVTIGVCGLPSEEKVKIEVKVPGGVTHNYQVTSTQLHGEKYEAYFDYTPNLNEPIGEHVLTFSGTGWSLQTTLHVIDADSARLYEVNKNKVIFYKFQPNEKVRLLLYKRALNSSDKKDILAGWKEYQMGKDGSLTIDVALEKGGRFIAVGEISGQVIYQSPEYGYDFYLLTVAPSDFYCAGAPNPVGVSPQGYAVVVSDSLPLYSAEWLNYKEFTIGKQIDVLPQSTVLQTTSNPRCVNGTWWWEVSCKDTICRGIAQEAEAGKIYLKPFQEAATTLGNENNKSFTCPGAPKSRISTGITARVTFTDGTPVRLRKKPGYSEKIINKLPEGTQFKVFGGPECVDRTIWWQIELNDGVDGWIAEGDTNSYYIEPYK
jgi:hypothetical protein